MAVHAEGPLATSVSDLLDFFSSCNRKKQLKLIYKKMWYQLKNSQAVKQGVALCKMASMKKLWNTGGSQEMAVMKKF